MRLKLWYCVSEEYSAKHKKQEQDKDRKFFYMYNKKYDIRERTDSERSAIISRWLPRNRTRSTGAVSLDTVSQRWPFLFRPCQQGRPGSEPRPRAKWRGPRGREDSSPRSTCTQREQFNYNARK